MEALYVEAAKAITKLVVTRPVEHLKLAWGIKDQLEKLKKEFIYIQAFLQDIERVNHRHHLGGSNNQTVNAWLRRVLDLAYRADDVMDDYDFEILHRSARSWDPTLINTSKGTNNKKKQPVKKLVATFNELKNRPLHKRRCRMFNPIAFRFKISGKVGYILRSFDNLYKDAAKLGIRPADMVASTVRGSVDIGEETSRAIQDSLEEVREFAIAHRSEFVGRQRDQEELVKVLCNSNNDEDVSTIVIAGMGGLGKTTLARKLYDNEAVIDHFAERFWICVSDNFSVKRILREMSEKLTGAECKLSNTEDIIQRVLQFLRGKRYIVVLDDVWDHNQTKWNTFKNCLRRIGGSTGSSILVTSRNRDIARTVESRYMHELTGLSDEESWTFFVQKAFHKSVATYNPELEKIGRNIVKKCKGLPLAIDVIGGLLRMKENVSEWKSIEMSKIWNLPQDNSDIIPSLLLSFSNLESLSLKRCFAYCAIFPNDALIDREDLINMWNAQGFLQEQSGSSLTPEELGGKYFDILLNNSLLQAEIQYSFHGSVTKKYYMHYLVHDLALYVSRHEWLIVKGVDKMGDPSECRHLTILPDNDDITSVFPTQRMRWLRTLHSAVRLPRDMLMHTKNLRVLKLVAIGLKEVPPSIIKFTHLRYLDVSHNSIVALPDSITGLHHLQTLRIIGQKLKELPTSLYRLVNLRHLHLTFRSWCLPRGIQCLTALQTLPMLELMESQGWEISELGALSEIKGILSISGLEHVKSKGEAEKVGICNKPDISELQLIWSRRMAANHFDVLDALQPHLNLKLLMITGYDSLKFPPWMMSMMSISEAGDPTPFNNLVQIELLYCENCQQLPTLGHLPCLRDLSMYSMLSVEDIRDEFYHPGNVVQELPPTFFPALKTLNISNFESLIEWALPSVSILDATIPEATSAFTSLETLRIEYCDQLIQSPTKFPSLRQLRVDKSLKGEALYNVIRDSYNELTLLEINEAAELVELPNELTDCRSLKELKLHYCPDLQSLPDGLGSRLTSLHCLSIVQCLDLIEIPATVGQCQSLKSLCIRNCPKLEIIPDLSQLIHTEEVQINGCIKLSCLPHGLQNLPRLNSLSIGGFKTLELESSNVEISQLPFPALKLLSITDDDYVEEVPEWIGDLALLQKLELKRCKNLKQLPSQDAMLRLTTLAALVINSCPILHERCAKEDGSEWNKICHIRFISINLQTVQELPT